MTRIQHLIPVLAYAFAPVACAHLPAPGPPHALVSSWRAPLNAPHDTDRVVVNRRFAFGYGPSQSDIRRVLYTEAIYTTTFLTRNEDDSHVVIDAWGARVGDSAYRIPLWHADVPGSQAQLLTNYYDVVSEGCCGTLDTHTYVSLASGRPVFSFTSNLVTLYRSDALPPAGSSWPQVAYLDAQGTIALEGRGSSEHVIGELVLVRGDSVLSRVLITSPTATTMGMNSVVMLHTADGREDRNALEVREDDVVSVSIAWDDSPPAIIPIRDGAFVLRGATFPNALSGRVIP